MPRLAQALPRLCRVLLLVCGLPVLAWAAQPAGGSLSVLEPWARATPPGATVGGAFLVIENPGAADQLLRIESPVSGTVEMHQTSMKDGMMQMREVKSLTVPAHGQVRFAPGGLHVMLLGLKHPLVEGQHFPMTLVFQNAGSVKVDVIVKGLGAEGGS